MSYNNIRIKVSTQSILNEILRLEIIKRTHLWKAKELRKLYPLSTQTILSTTEKVQLKGKSLNNVRNVHSSKRISGPRVKGEIYIVGGIKKKWDGSRFARCCQVLNCCKHSQGASLYCKVHGGFVKCKKSGCTNKRRGGSVFCNSHRNLCKRRKRC